MTIEQRLKHMIIQEYGQYLKDKHDPFMDLLLKAYKLGVSEAPKTTVNGLNHDLANEYADTLDTIAKKLRHT